MCDSDSRWTRALDGGLVVRATDRPDSPLLTRFMAGYDRAFVLPDEREEIAGFRACLALNAASRHRFGRTHSELVMVIEDSETGRLLGGANFLATRIDDRPTDHPPVTVALNYLFVEAASRGRGLSRILKREIEATAATAVDTASTGPLPALFIEQNDPFKLTLEEYAADNAHSGIDQIDRLAVWARLDSALVDFPYVQPALSPGKASDDGLAYAVMNLSLDAMEARWFAAHLESFFGISVLKGGDPAADAVAGPQLDGLATMAAAGRSVPLRPLQRVVDALHAADGWPQSENLAAFARQVASGSHGDHSLEQPA